MMDEAKQGADEPVDIAGADIAKGAHERAGVDIPERSAMSMKLQQIINRFRIREEGNRKFIGEEDEARRLDLEMKKFYSQKNYQKLEIYLGFATHLRSVHDVLTHDTT